MHLTSDIGTAFGSEAFCDDLRERLNADSDFIHETRWFDGSVLLEDGTGQCWMKIYRGSVLETLPFAPVFGFTFKLAGPADSWSALVSGERCFSDLISPGLRHFDGATDVSEADALAPPALRIEGNGLEAGRMREAIHLLAACIVEVAAKGRR